jgi:hypothetical protein
MTMTRSSNMREPADKSLWSNVLAFVAAVLLATVWGAIVQTQFNIGALNSIGADISMGLRLQSTLSDIFSGFSPTYAIYFVIPSLFVAFAVAWFISARRPGSAPFWFALGGGLAILLVIPLVHYLSPLALLIGATRESLCAVLMALGGVGAGLLFATFPGGDRRRQLQRGADPFKTPPQERVVLR